MTRPPHRTAARESVEGTTGALARIELQVAMVRRHATHAHDDALDQSGYLILYELSMRGPSHITALAQRLGVDGSTITRQVSLLEQAGRVHRTRDPFDRRSIVVEPTAMGLADLETHREQRARAYAAILARWSALDQSLLAELLERLTTDLEEYGQER